jgi:chorismate dehydratase
MSSKSTTKTTLALIPYLNCEPFYAGLDALDLDVVREPPRELGRLAETGVATCGPMAVTDWFRLRDRFDPLGDFGIACEGPVHSVMLFAKREIARLAGARVGVTEDSSTSAAMIRLLLDRKHGLRGVRYARGEHPDDDARLLIGDRALAAASEGLDGFPFVHDLGEEWWGWQGLPFVFARWTVAKEVPAEDRRRIEDAVGESLASWEARVGEIAARRGPSLGLDEDGIREYLSAFTYRLGPVERLGEQTFESLLAEEAEEAA